MASDRGYTDRPISPRSGWPRRCTSTWRSTTSVSRSTCRTTPPRWRCSRRRSHSTRDTCILERHRDSASNSTNSRRQHSPIRRPTFRSTGCRTEPFMTGDTLTRPAVPTRTAATKLIVVVRAQDATDYDRILDALVDAGICSVELTLTTPGTIARLPRLLDRFGHGAHIGVGT